MGIYEDYEDVLDMDIPYSNYLCPQEVPGGFENFTTLTVPRELGVLLSYGPNFVPPGVHDSVTKKLEVVDELRQMYLGYGHTIGTIYFREMIERFSLELMNMDLDRGGDVYLIKLFRNMLSVSRDFLSAHKRICIVQSDKSKSTVLMYLDDYNNRMTYMIYNYQVTGVYAFVHDFHKLKRGIVGGFLNIRRNLRNLCYGTVTSSLMSSSSSSLTSSSPSSSSSSTPSSGCSQTESQIMGKLRWHLSVMERFGNSHAEIYRNGRLPYLYGTIKSHKEGYPLRPICSTQRWYSHSVQRLLLFCLKELFSHCALPNNVTNVDKFVKELRRVPVCAGYKFIKLDLVDMYTNIDKNKVQKLLYLWSESPLFRERCPVPVYIFQCMVHFSLFTSAYVGYGGHVYKQIKGLPQGACDSGMLANVYIDYLLQTHYSLLFDQHGVIFWYRYIDDFLFYIPDSGPESFVNAFKLVLGMDVTIEEEDDGHISFLDVGIVRTRDNLEIYHYVKPMASVRMMNYYTEQPVFQKRNTCLSMINKILYRDSTAYVVHDLMKIANVFSLNSYPLLFVASLMRRAVGSYIGMLQEDYQSNGGNDVRTLERINSLYGYLLTYSHIVRVPNLYCLRPRVPDRVSVAGMLTSIRIFPFRGEALSSLLMRMCKHHALGKVVYSSRESRLIRLLKMSLVAPSPDVSDTIDTTTTVVSTAYASTVAVVSQCHESLYLTTCLDCSYAYIMYGIGNPMSLLDAAMADENSPLACHVRDFSHEVSGRIVRLSDLGEMQ